MHRLLFALAVVAVVLPCHAVAQQIVLTAAQRQAMDVRVGKIEPAADVPLDGLPAVVRAPLEDSAVVTAPFAGVVVAVLARQGQMVGRHQPLARIQSREAMTLGADLAAARGDSRVAAAQAARDRQLLLEGIIPAARVQAAQARREAAAARLHELQAARAMAPAAAGVAPGIYELRAPLAGRVLERSVRLGESIAALAKAYVIARRDRVMLELHVPARHAAAVRVGQRVRVPGGAQGKVTETAGAIDAASQSVLVRAQIDTESLRPGQQLTATLLLPAPADAWSVPSSALVERGGGYVLFVARGAGYSAVPVKLLAQTSAGRSVVVAALAVDTKVVVSGAGALKVMAQGAR
ncbi:MAG: efflux RND transporter periplasmic adaptor subunit [Rhodanobacter sp.]|nr:MAG: efflux RND transporter periplasmic adaptor subunit [Rhodanobacter sp.]